MDENKRDDILSEEIEPQEVVEETPAEESAPEETGASELEKELEELTIVGCWVHYSSSQIRFMPDESLQRSQKLQQRELHLHRHRP